MTTPEKLAAEMYPGLTTVPFVRYSRAAFLHGHRLGKAEGDAEGYARAKAELAAQGIYWTAGEEGTGNFDLIPTSPAPDTGEGG